MRLAIVVPRYAPGVAGGAEALARGVAHAAARAGATVELWTTCARDHYSWANELPAGVEREGPLTVRCFPVALRALGRHWEIEHQLAAGARLTPDEQFEWLEGGPHSPALYAHVAAHAAEWDAVLVLPYATPLTHAAAWAAPERVIFWPCLHDEPYAYLAPVRLLLESVRAVAFNAPEEAALATERLRVRLPRWGVLGVGVPAPPLPDPLPFVDPTALLVISRLEGGKNVPLLYRYAQRYVDEGGDLHLVVVGRGPLEPPTHPAFDFRGFVSEEEKLYLCASSLAHCQPSLNESFSITCMESWHAGRPVLVHRDCPVTRGHVQRSKGGLWFSDYATFTAAVEWLQRHPIKATRLGQNGRAYVQQNYAWPMVLARLAALMDG